MQANVKKKSIKGAFWNTLEQLGKQVVQFVIGIILVRILSPSDFGLFAIIVLIINFASIIVNSGFMQALVRLDKIDDDDYSTVFWFGLFISLIIYIILFFLARPIALFCYVYCFCHRFSRR